ncbi:hypothetical protein SAMN04487981_10917 [Streptomyces sp. cf386]|uniref:hypothetical protein n=1 Tax=Streptomyces sp. cf386 TaxID=1761904 RepID=UPI000889D0A7|nr:hypothetical protein [Streptomyces sp. cf386]SDO19039.1 hypothetical protein SAMN04487981_10917 [Streptomyces sp. cf386]
MRRPTPHTALRQLEAFVGAWDMWAAGRTVGPIRTEFAWLEGGAFLVQRADVTPETALPGEWAAHAPFPTVALTGYDDTAEEYTVLYADGRGVTRVYRGSLTDRTWRQWRSAPGFHQRLTATVSPDGTTIEGSWEQSPDGERWTTDFDVRFVRTERP